MSKNPHKALEAIEHLVGGDFGMDMESLLILKRKPKRVISQLKEAARIITEIYTIAHAENSRHCNHPEWEKKKYEILKQREY